MKLISATYALFNEDFYMSGDSEVNRKDYYINGILYSQLDMFGSNLYIPRNNKEYMEFIKTYKFDKKRREY